MHRAVKNVVNGRILAFVAVAQNVVADPRVTAAATPARNDRVNLRAVWNTNVTVTAAVTAEKKFTRHAGVGPRGRRLNSQPNIV
jgi:hypothetical protein